MTQFILELRVLVEADDEADAYIISDEMMGLLVNSYKHVGADNNAIAIFELDENGRSL